jgi:hypothetical protein
LGFDDGRGGGEELLSSQVALAAAPHVDVDVARVPVIEGKTWYHPVLAGKTLLVRNAEHMASFRLSLERR